MDDRPHERYDSDERRLLEGANEELWAGPLLDAMVDVAPEIIEAVGWHGVPDNAPTGWESRSSAMLALAALGLRATRTVAIVVRAGYGAEGFGNLRRVVEAAGHAVKVAKDESGEYAANWLIRRGNASSPSRAFGTEAEQRDIWKAMSGLVHANFADFANMSSEIDGDGRLLHRVGPRRVVAMDNATLWLAGRHLARVLAAALTIRPEAAQAAFLEAGTRLDQSEERAAAEVQAFTRERHINNRQH